MGVGKVGLVHDHSCTRSRRDGAVYTGLEAVCVSSEQL